MEIIMRRFLALGSVLLVGLFACQNSTAPEPETPIPDCERYDTGTVTFQNKSVNNYTYNVIWDGSLLTTLGPGETSAAYTVAAGKHSLTFKISNTGRQACNPANPVIVRCQAHGYSCSG